MVDILFVTVGVFRVMDAAAKAKHQSPFLKRYPAISSSGNFFFLLFNFSFILSSVHRLNLKFP